MVHINHRVNFTKRGIRKDKAAMKVVEFPKYLKQSPRTVFFLYHSLLFSELLLSPKTYFPEPGSLRFRQ